MKRVQIDEIVGTEVLAKDIISDSGATLMIAGTVIRSEYAQKLKFLDIHYVYIKDIYEDELERTELEVEETMELKIKKQCQQRVKETIELYASYGIEQLTPIISIANNIIEDILEQPEVMYNICGIREKSEGVFAHCVNVCALSVLIAIKMKFSVDKIKEIAIGSLLHDIGITCYKNNTELQELAVNDELDDEFKKHVVYGYSIVNAEDWISSTAKDIVLSHHELYDGSGYPFGIEGRKIKKGTRIVAVCDAFDRLVYSTAGKKYKVFEAIDYIVSKADIFYDLAVVKVFLDTVAAYPNGSVVITNRGDRAIVIKQNRKCPTRPVIRRIENIHGVAYIGEEDLNLVEDLTLFIVDAEL